MQLNFGKNDQNIIFFINIWGVLEIAQHGATSVAKPIMELVSKNHKSYYKKKKHKREEFGRYADGQAYYEDKRDDIDCNLLMKENCINHGS